MGSPYGTKTALSTATGGEGSILKSNRIVSRKALMLRMLIADELPAHQFVSRSFASVQSGLYFVAVTPFFPVRLHTLNGRHFGWLFKKKPAETTNHLAQ